MDKLPGHRPPRTRVSRGRKTRGLRRAVSGVDTSVLTYVVVCVCVCAVICIDRSLSLCRQMNSMSVDPPVRNHPLPERSLEGARFQAEPQAVPYLLLLLHNSLLLCIYAMPTILLPKRGGGT